MNMVPWSAPRELPVSAAAVGRDPAEPDALHGEVVLELGAAPRAEELRGAHRERGAAQQPRLLQLLQLLAHVAGAVGAEALEEARGGDAGRYGDAAEQRALQLADVCLVRVGVRVRVRVRARTRVRIRVRTRVRVRAQG